MSAETAADSSLVTFRRAGAVAIVTLNRPQARNALSEALRAELRAHLTAAEADPEIRVVLLKGEGKNFCSGADVKEMHLREPIPTAWTPNRVDVLIEAMSKPVIAAMHGTTLGGGMELALACTLRIVSEDFVGGFPEVKIGVFPAAGGTQRLPRMIGEARALDLMLTGRRFSAEEAVALGIASRMVPTDQLFAAALAMAEEIAAGSPLAIRVIIESVRRASDLGRTEGIDYERRLFGILCASQDMKEGVAAWKEKRTPHFTGR